MLGSRDRASGLLVDQMLNFIESKLETMNRKFAAKQSRERKEEAEALAAM